MPLRSRQRERSGAFDPSEAVSLATQLTDPADALGVHNERLEVSTSGVVDNDVREDVKGAAPVDELSATGKRASLQ